MRKQEYFDIFHDKDIIIKMKDNFRHVVCGCNFNHL